MNTQWQQFLRAQGARFSGNTVIDFGNPDAERTATVRDAILTDLSSYGVVTAEGADAAVFLQNQLTNDVRPVNGKHGQLNGYCTPQGRLLAVFRLLTDGERYYLRMPAGLIEPLLKRLRMYILMSKVTLAHAGDELLCMGVAGSGAAGHLKRHFGNIPEAANEVIQTGDCLVACLPGTERYEIYGKTDALQALWLALQPLLQPVGSDAWPLLDILEGIPTVYPPTSERFVPQTLNLDRINGVSFKKGCFPGQEVVARMHYRGKAKRRMVRFSTPADTPPSPGSPVMEAKTSREAGDIVDARPWPDGGCQGLAAVQLASLESELVLEDGTNLKILELPYALEGD